MYRTSIAAVALVAAAGGAQAQSCPAITLTDMMGVEPGAFPQQYELAEFEALAGCDMAFSTNPDIATMNGEIQGNPDLPPLADRLPAEPLVVVPYESIGRYGGTLNALSNATEAGTSDFLSTRHVNLVRYADDLTTIVPNVAKSWSWNDAFTELTMELREGHKWSDGAPFTSADVAFWLENLALDPSVIESPRDYVLAAGEPIGIEIIDDTTFKFVLPSPKPGLLVHFATSYAQPFQPRHFLGQFHPDIDPNADANAAEYGFESGYAAIEAYYGSSDWTDTPSPILRFPDTYTELPKATQPTLESHIYVMDTTEGRKLVANPYFHMVDTTGQQLPYISRQDELYANDNEVRILKLVNAEADYKSQSLSLASAPLLLENQEAGDFTIQLRPQIAMYTFAFNVTSEDLAKREVFGDVRFRRAMSVAMNREEMNEVAFFGQGEPKQYTGFSPRPDFVDPALEEAFAQYDPDLANGLLDEVGLADVDGDGFRELPNGDPFVLTIQFATQGLATEVAELVAQNWSDVGVQTSVREVTPDEYRSAQSANQLDVLSWLKGQPAPIHTGDNTYWSPPFDGYFDVRTGMLWAEYIESGGTAGVEPPAWTAEMSALADAFQAASPGSPEQNEAGARLAQMKVDQMLFIGTVVAPAPVYHRNALENVPEFRTWSYEYYRTYPYRAPQWWLSDES